MRTEFTATSGGGRFQPPKARWPYDEVCVAYAEDFWAGKGAFGYYMDVART